MRMKKMIGVKFIMKERKGSNFATLSAVDRKKIIEGIRVQHPIFNKITKEIRECHLSKINGHKPKSMLIVGGAGTGKSSIFKNYVSENKVTKK